MLQRRASPAKGYARRTIQVIALVGTILIGIIALALIATQTPWFRDWLRKFVIRESKQYVNGDLSIGSLGGNLFYGVQLGDVSLDVNGEHVMTLKRLEIKYSVAELISKGVTIREIHLEQPYILLRHDANGWNVANLVKKQQQEANRQGPGKPISLPDVEIADGRAVIEDKAPSDSYRLPSRVDALNLKAAYAYEPVHYSVTLDRLSFAGKSPDLALNNLTGRLTTRDDKLNVDKIAVQTPQSAVTIDGVISNYLSDPNLAVTVSSPKVSLPEFAGVLPSLAGYNLHPSLDLKAAGPQDNLRLTLKENSEAGAIDGAVTADVKAPNFAARGDVNVHDLNLAPLLKDPSQKSDITAAAKLDVRMATSPAGAPILDRTRGRVALDAPKVIAAGYRADNVRVTADIAGRHVAIDGRAAAYGGTATAKGTVIMPAQSGGPLQFDIAGNAAQVNLAGLPGAVNAPRVRTDINASAYHVTGTIAKSGTTIDGDVTMAQSTVAGGTIVGGTTAAFGMRSRAQRHGSVLADAHYSARGGVRNINLYRMGQAFNVEALNKPDYDSRVNADFDVKGNGTTVEAMTVDGTVTVTDSQVMGGRVPRLAVVAHLANGAVQGRANGQLQGFDPARLTGNATYKGHVNATVDAAFGVKNVSAPITPDAVTADGHITLADTDVAGLKITNADVQGQYANQRGDIRQATVKGPDIDVQASGPIALDQTGSSNVKYHVGATDLAHLGTLFDLPLTGIAVVDGTLTGNAASLKTTGTLAGSNVGYQDNKALDLHSTFNVTVPNLEFAHANVQAQTTGTFIEAAGLQISELRANTTYADQKLDFETHIAEAPQHQDAKAAKATGQAPTPSGPRELDAGGTVIFHSDHQEIHLPRLTLRTQGIVWQTAAGAEAAIQYGNNRVQMQNVHLVSGNQTLDVGGAFSVGGNTAPGAIDVRAQNVDLSQLEKLALQNRGITGILNANAKITGTATAPAVSGHIAVANGGVQQFKYQSLNVDATYGNDRIGLDARLQQGPGVELTAKGTVPMSALKPNPPGVTGHVEPHPGDELDVRVQSSRVDLGIVQGFTDQVTNVTGTVQADVHVTGSGEDPHLNGYVDIQGGGFAVKQAGTSFTGLTTRIELQPDRIHVPMFQLKDQHNDVLSIHGDLAVHERQGGAVNVAIESNNFKLMDNELGDLHVETHLKLTGEVRAPRLEGDVRVDQARLELDKILMMFASPYSEQALPDVVTAEDTVTTDKGADEATRDALAKGREVSAASRPKQDATAPQTPAAGGPIALNVHLVVPDNLVARGQDLRPGGPAAAQIGNVNATLGADLHIDKKPDAPILIRGTADTVRGFYEFQGRRFELVRGGTMQFLGLADINPNVDVSATRLIPNTGVTAKIHITGTLRAPEIGLSSDPPLDEADILSLIVFNRNVNDLGTGERASLAETAGGIASGFVASPLSKSIGKALDVDLFEITTSDPETGETAGGLTLGKQVSDKAFVRYRQQFGQRSYTEFEIEYDLARFLRLQTSVAPETTAAANRLTQRRIEKAGVDLIFFFSY